MDTSSNGYRPPDQRILRDLQMQRERLLAQPDDKPPLSPWVVIGSGLISGAILALVVIDFTLRTLPLHHG